MVSRRSGRALLFVAVLGVLAHGCFGERHRRPPGSRPLAVRTIPPELLDLVTTKKALANLATVMPNGNPQVTPVWFDFDGCYIRVNSARGRLKDKNMRRDPRVALAIIDPENPYRYLEIRGRIVEITETGAAEHIDKMAKKYLGADKYPYRQPGEVRVMYKIQPERTSMMG